MPDYGTGVCLIPFNKKALEPWLLNTPAWRVVAEGTASRIAVRTAEDLDLLESEATRVLAGVIAANATRKARGRKPGGLLETLLREISIARKNGIPAVPVKLDPPDAIPRRPANTVRTDVAKPVDAVGKLLHTVAPLEQGDAVAWVSRHTGEPAVGIVHSFRNEPDGLKLVLDAFYAGDPRKSILAIIPREWAVRLLDIPADEPCEVGKAGDADKERSEI